MVGPSDRADFRFFVVSWLLPRVPWVTLVLDVAQASRYASPRLASFHGDETPIPYPRFPLPFTRVAARVGSCSCIWEALQLARLALHED